jgi:thioredoxin 1
MEEFSPMRFAKYIFLTLLTMVVAGTAFGAPRDIYPDPSQAHADLAAALKQAAATHKRVLLDFGGNWCPDCRVLDIYLHDPSNLPALKAGFVLVHVNIGHMDQNLDIAERYGIPLKKGVPALAVADAHGKLLYSQKGGEFESMRTMQVSSVSAFLAQWKPGRTAAAR